MHSLGNTIICKYFTEPPNIFPKWYQRGQVSTPDQSGSGNIWQILSILMVRLRVWQDSLLSQWSRLFCQNWKPLGGSPSWDDMLARPLTIWTVQMWPFRNLLQFGVPAEWSFKCALIMWMCRVIKVLVIGWIEKKGQWVLTTKKNIRGNVYLMPYCDMIQGFFLLSRLAMKYLSNATFGTGLVNQISVVERLDRLSGLLYAEFNE